MVSFLERRISGQFEFFGGVPYEILYDRMKNVFIRRVAGKTEVHSRALSTWRCIMGSTREVAPRRILRG